MRNETKDKKMVTAYPRQTSRSLAIVDRRKLSAQIAPERIARNDSGD